MGSTSNIAYKESSFSIELLTLENVFGYLLLVRCFIFFQFMTITEAKLLVLVVAHVFPTLRLILG